MQADPDGASCLNAMIPAGNTPTQLVGLPTLENGHVRIPFVQQNVQQIKIPRSADIPKYRIVSVYSGMYQDVEGGGVAERKGFEPSIRVNVYALSRGAPSATRPPLQRGIWGLEKPHPDRKPLNSVEPSKSPRKHGQTQMHAQLLHMWRYVWSAHPSVLISPLILARDPDNDDRLFQTRPVRPIQIQ